MLGKNGVANFQNKVRSVWQEMILSALRPYAQRLDESIDIEILAWLINCSIWGGLEFDIQTNRKYSQSYIAEQLKLLLFDSALASLGLRACPLRGSRTA
jgi:hypothetical protein